MRGVRLFAGLTAVGLGVLTSAALAQAAPAAAPAGAPDAPMPVPLLDAPAQRLRCAPAPPTATPAVNAPAVNAAVAAPSAGPNCASSYVGLPVPGIPDPITIAGGVAGDVTAAAVGKVLHGVSDWVAHGVVQLLQSLVTLIDSRTTPDLRAGWFIGHFRVMGWIAMVLVLPLLLASAMSAIVRQDVGPLLRAIGIQLPLAALGTGLAIQVVSLAVAATDGLCLYLTNGTGAATTTFLTGVGHGLDGLTGSPAGGAFGVVLVAGVLAVGALLVGLELVMRDAAVYVAMLFLPLALAGMVWPATMRWSRRVTELLVVLILSKFVIVAVLSLAASALAAGFQQGEYPGVIAGAAMMLLAGMAPYALLRLAPIVEAGAMGSLEGVSQRANPVRAATNTRNTVEGLLSRYEPTSPEQTDPPSDSPAGQAARQGAIAGQHPSGGPAGGGGADLFAGDEAQWAVFGSRVGSTAAHAAHGAQSALAVGAPAALGADLVASGVAPHVKAVEDQLGGPGGGERPGSDVGY